MKIGITVKLIILAFILIAFSAGFLVWYTLGYVSGVMESELYERANALAGNLAATSVDALLIDKPDFSMAEFDTEDTIDSFIKALHDSGFAVEVNGVEELNKFLENPIFYDIWKEWQQSLEAEDRISAEDLIPLVEVQSDVREKRYDELSSQQQTIIKRLNRILLERTYPVISPATHLIPNIQRLRGLAEGVLEHKDVVLVRMDDREGLELVQAGEVEEKEPLKEFSAPAVSLRPVLDAEEILFGLEEEFEIEKIGQVHIAVSLTSLHEKTAELKNTLFMVFLIVLVFSTAGITLAVKKYIGTPINDLILATRKVAEGNLEHRIKIKNKDEIGTLAAFFNKMANNLRKARKKIERKAYFDDLTGLPNRRLLDDRINHCLEKCKRYRLKAAILFIDLDDFKKINDTMGHAAGNEVLKKTAAKLKASVRKSDTVSRYGGDEFVVLIEDLKKVQDAEKAAKKILELLNETIFIDGKEIYITPSVGISIYPDHGDNLGDLIRKADIAMYRVKSEGQNSYRLFK